MLQLVNSRNPSAVHHNLLKLCLIDNTTTGSDSVMCAKFQINLMWYADFSNEETYQRDSPESYKCEISVSLQNN